MKVLMVNTNRYMNPSPVVPLGALIAAEAAQRAGHDVRFQDLAFVRKPLDALAQAVRTVRPEVVGLSVRNIDNNNLSSPLALIEGLPRLVAAVRDKSEARVVLGGPGVGVMPEAVLRASGADAAVVGDGEAVFPDLLDAFSRGRSAGTIPGVAWRDGDAIKVNGGHAVTAMEECLIPDFRKWLDVGKYLSRMCAIGVQTKRGCPYDCVYCTYALSEGREYRLCPPEAVAGAMGRAAADGIEDFEFVDNVFNSPYSHATGVCEEIIRSGLNTRVRLQSVELNPRWMDADLLGLMERAGFVGLGMTAESASDEVLAALGKGYTSDDVRRAAMVLSRARVPVVWMFLLGGPGETRESVEETLSFAESHVRDRDVAFFNVGVRVYPRTAMETIARREGMLAAPPEEMLSPVFYFSPRLDRRWLAGRIAQATSRNLNFLGPNSITAPFLPLVYRAAYGLGLRPPLWRHTRLLRRALRVIGKDPS